MTTFPDRDQTVGATLPGRRSIGPHDPEPVEIALLDRAGVILEVNAAWAAFARDNDGDPTRTGVGMSYLDVCDAAGDDPVAVLAAAAVRAALSGDLPGPLQVVVPCHAPSVERWYDLLVSPRRDDAGDLLGATVTLSRAGLPAGRQGR
jgi:hypothetical protein